ncbi:MAG TPA: TraR/DksA C4-type zinc finger protein [Chitinophagaceae bacterium]
MATKKPLPQKKGKVKPIKNARPAVKKAPKAVVKKAAVKKPVVKKAAPAAKKTVKKAVSKKAMPKHTPNHAHKKAEAKKAVVKATKKLENKKPEPKAKPAPVAAKPVVAAKVAAKPTAKKEPAKPVKVVIPKTTTKTVKKYEPDFTKSVLDSAEYVNNGPSMRYSDLDLKEFREIITKKLDAAKKELNYLQGLITRKDESGEMEDARYMTMEDGSVSMEREQLSQMASRQIQFIDHLEKAMMRIENKTYGICRITGKLIDKARLRAVPHATLSIEAKQMMNK